MGLDALALLVQVVQQLVVSFVEDRAGNLLQAGEDVTGAGGVLASLQPRPKLTCNQECLIDYVNISPEHCCDVYVTISLEL